MNIVPTDFGAVGGTHISNKDTILDDINIALGKPKNPSVEYLFVTPFVHIKLPFGYGISYNTYGHATIRYTTPDGMDVVMNIQGKEKGKIMVRFYDAKEYLYGTDSTKIGSQKGIYNRTIVGLRVENVDPEAIKRMHEYYLRLQTDEQQDLVRFNIIFGPIINMFREMFNLPEYGNCAKWISEGLRRANLVTSVSIWPKSIFINMFENSDKTEAKTQDNVSVVYYQRPEHSQLSYGKKAFSIEEVAPLQPIRSFMYSDLKPFANCIVTVPNNDICAVVTRVYDPIRPSKFRNIVNDPYFIAGSVVTSGFTIRHIYKNKTKYAKGALRLFRLIK